jgi:hypothetical protein
MSRRFLLAILLIVFAFGLQFLLASSGVFVDVILATLITFALFFDLLGLVVFILLAIFVINWKPAVSPEILLFAALPLAAYGIRTVSRWHAWALNLLSIFFATLLVYLVIAPGFIIYDPGVFATDLMGSMIFGQIVFSLLSYYGQ